MPENPNFIRTKNVRNLEDLMDGLERGSGKGRFACIYSPAGRGKTETTLWWHANNNSIYCLCQYVWRSSELKFLQGLAREFGFMDPPKSKADCFVRLVDRLVEDPVPIFLDEIDRYPASVLEIVRDLTDLTGAPAILIGEPRIVDWMAREDRVWSRTAEVLEFQPWDAADIVLFAQRLTGVSIEREAAALLHASSGDFRDIEQNLGTCKRLPGAENGITVKMVETAIKARSKSQVHSARR
jgi:DNA transposition AAA+ family ATPase